MSTKQFYSILLIGIVCLGFTGLAKGYENITYDVVDSNSTDLDSSADKGTETNFAYCQDQSPDSDYMTIQEINTGGATATITFVSAGGGISGTGTSFAVAYPSSIGAGNLLILQCHILDLTGGAVNTPTDWTSMYTDATGSDDGGRQYLFYKFATGSESGTLTVTTGTSALGKGFRMYQWDGVASSSFYSGKNFETTTSATINDVGVTTPTNNYYAVNFIFIGEDGGTISSFTGETGGNWIEVIASYESASGTDLEMNVQGDVIETSGTIDGGTYSYGQSDPYGVVGFYLVPETTPTNYEINFEYQFTSCITNRMVTELCFYVGSHTGGSETLNVNYWTTSFQSLTTITSTGWKNISITPTSTYTIQLKGATETSDGTSDTWAIDCILIHTYDKITIVNNTEDVTGKYEVRGDQSTGWTIYLNYTGIPCDSTDLTVHNNTDHTTGKYETSYNAVTGWDIWLNYTGELPVFNHYENILHATGSHEHNTENDGYTINSWANYSGSAPTFNEYENIVNATGTHENNWDATNWIYNVWANYTGDTTPITLYENIINGATGTHEYLLNSTGHYVWANYSGTGGGCVGIVWVNYTDSNLTFNVSVDKATNDNTSTYEINEDDWLFMSGFSLENGELGLFLIFVLFSLAFVVDKESENKSIWKPILLFMDTPISLATGLYYLGLGATFSVSWWVGVCLFVFAVLLAFGGLYYGLSFGRSSKK